MRSKATGKTEGYKSRLWASLKQLCRNFVIARFLVSNKKQALCLKYFYIRVTWTVYPEGLSMCITANRNKQDFFIHKGKSPDVLSKPAGKPNKVTSDSQFSLKMLMLWKGQLAEHYQVHLNYC